MSPQQQEADSLEEPLLSESERIEESQSESERLSDEDDERLERSSLTSEVSPNVSRILNYTLLAFGGRSIWQSSVLATYVFLLTHNNRSVGLVTAVSGIAQLITAFPAGAYADAYGRDSILKAASMIGILSIAVTVYVCCVQRTLNGLFVALALWGCGWAMSNTSLQPLLADSVRERDVYFTKRNVRVTLGNTLGPCLSLIMFAILGNTWTVADCAWVMALGQVVCLPAVLLLWTVSDKYTLQIENNDDDHGDVVEPLLTECNESDEEEDTAGHENSADGEGEESSRESSTETSCCCTWSTPVLIAVADVGSGLASGMSIRYFPIFFVRDLHLNPVQVQILYVVAPLLNAWLQTRALMLAKIFSRCRVHVAFKWTGVTLMLAMMASHTHHLSTYVTCILYIIRTAFMNSTSALMRSLLMDNVGKNKGKWSAMESVNMFGWSGSAFIGGLLVDHLGMMPLFGATAFGQFLATAPIIVLARRGL